MILKFTIFGGYGIPSTRLWCENIRNIENIPGKERKRNLFHDPFFHFISKNIHTGSSGIQGWNGSRLLSPLDSFPPCNLKPLVHILKKIKKIKKSTRKNDQQKYFKLGDSERVVHSVAKQFDRAKQFTRPFLIELNESSLKTFLTTVETIKRMFLDFFLVFTRLVQRDSRNRH